MVVVNEPGCGLIKIVAIFQVGRDREQKKALAQATANMLKKSTIKKTNLKLQSAIDRLGANIEIYASPLYITAELHCLKLFEKEGLDLFFEILFEATFMKDDWDISKKISKETIIQNEFQTDFWADKLLSESILGQDNMYGYYSSATDYDSIEIKEINSFYQAYIKPNRPNWYLAGDINKNTEKLIKSKEAGYSLKKTKRNIPAVQLHPKSIIKKSLAEATQASIRLGLIIPRDSFEDFLSLELINTYLGGYYLSQLMMSLRIKHGYTYGVYSHLLHLPEYSLLSISYETDERNIDSSLSAIKNLFSRLDSKKSLDLKEAKEQYFSMWSKQSERSLQEIMYEIRLSKLGYSYTEYIDRVQQYKSLNPSNIEKYKSTLLNFESYTQTIVF